VNTSLSSPKIPIIASENHTEVPVPTLSKKSMLETIIRKTLMHPLKPREKRTLNTKEFTKGYIKIILLRYLLYQESLCPLCVPR
jgi:hypothetical protein